MKHKTALVSAMSIAGVMAAGATALGANLGILNSGQGIGELSAVAEQTTTSLASAVTSTQPTAPLADLVAYQINDVGLVTLAREGRRLTLGSADVGDWTYEVRSQGRQLEVVFRLDDREINFEAKVENGQVMVDVWEEQVVIQGGGSGGGSAATTATTSATTATTQPSTTQATYGEDDSHDDDSYDDSDYSDDDHAGDDGEDHSYEGGEDDD